MKVRWTRAALRDIQAVHEFISADNRTAAARMVEQLLAAIDGLRSFPESGRKGRVARTLEMVVRPYIVVYRIHGYTLELLAIIHGSRKWPESFPADLLR